MKQEVVVDTNVAVVANRKTEQASNKCVQKCIDELKRIHGECRVLLDHDYLILKEYKDNLNLSGQPEAGDAFFKWLWDNQVNDQYTRRVRIDPQDDRGFEQFPDDPGLVLFDRDDRKFVAVAAASGSSPTIVNASDSGWWEHREALRRHGVDVCFLCPELMMPR